MKSIVRTLLLSFTSLMMCASAEASSPLHLYHVYYVTDVKAAYLGQQQKQEPQGRIALLLKNKAEHYVLPSKQDMAVYAIARDALFMGGPLQAAQQSTPLYLFDPGLPSQPCPAQAVSSVTIAPGTPASEPGKQQDNAWNALILEGCSIHGNRYEGLALEGADIKQMLRIEQQSHIKITTMKDSPVLKDVLAPEEAKKITAGLPEQVNVGANWFNQQAAKHPTDTTTTAAVAERAQVRGVVYTEDARIKPFIQGAAAYTGMKKFEPILLISGADTNRVLFQRKDGMDFVLTEMRSGQLMTIQELKAEALQ